MPAIYPKPPITVAGLFRNPHAQTPPELPVWWRNNDKQRVLIFLSPRLPSPAVLREVDIDA